MKAPALLGERQQEQVSLETGARVFHFTHTRTEMLNFQGFDQTEYTVKTARTGHKHAAMTGCCKTHTGVAK